MLEDLFTVVLANVLLFAVGGLLFTAFLAVFIIPFWESRTHHRPYLVEFIYNLRIWFPSKSSPYLFLYNLESKLERTNLDRLEEKEKRIADSIDEFINSCQKPAEKPPEPQEQTKPQEQEQTTSSQENTAQNANTKPIKPITAESFKAFLLSREDVFLELIRILVKEDPPRPNSEELQRELAPYQAGLSISTFHKVAAEVIDIYHERLRQNKEKTELPKEAPQKAIAQQEKQKPPEQPPAQPDAPVITSEESNIEWIALPLEELEKLILPPKEKPQQQPAVAEPEPKPAEPPKEYKPPPVTVGIDVDDEHAGNELRLEPSLRFRDIQEETPRTEESKPKERTKQPPRFRTTNFKPERNRQQFHTIPKKIDTMYSEIIRAYNIQFDNLCIGGLRALIEGVCKANGAQGETLAQKINDLADHLPPLAIKYLHAVRALGNAVMHDLEKPITHEELGIVIDNIEKVLKVFYGVDKPTRSTRSLKDEDFSF